MGRAKIFVTDVAPTDDRDLTVGSERLVVHAPVHAPELGDEIERTGGARDERVVQPHLEVRLHGQRGKGGVYQALDLNVNPPRLCLIKEGRKHGELTWDGRDDAGSSLGPDTYSLALDFIIGESPLRIGSVIQIVAP